MPYLGNVPAEAYSQMSYQDLTGGSGTSFTLDYPVGNENEIEVFVNNVRQEPTVAYTTAGTALTMTGTIAATDDFYVVFQGKAQQTIGIPEKQTNGDYNFDSNTLYVDASTSRVGISTSTPSVELDVSGAAKVSGDLTVDTNILYVDSTNNRVGVGTSSPSELLELNVGSGNLVQKFNGATATFGIRNQSDGSFGHFDYTNSRWLDLRDYSSDNWKLFTGGSERMRIDSSGLVGLNTTSPSSSTFMTIQSSSTIGALQMNGPTTNGYYASVVEMPSGSTYGFLFKNAGSAVGSIRINASSTAYNTSSDYRLKTAVTYDWDATSRLKQLKPARFEWIADGDDAVPVDGFLAHEVQDIVPEAITGTKDAMRDEEYEVTPAVLDEDGNEVTPAVMGTRSVPDYQGIDQSKLVPLLVKTIQELEARIAALENA